MNILNYFFNKDAGNTANIKAENSPSLDALMPFGIALSLLVFAFIPASAKAASTTYYVDIPNLGSYGAGAVSYICNGANCSVNGAGNGSANGSNSGAYRTSTAPASQYPNYAYQYYKNPNGLSGSGSNSGYSNAPYVQQKATYTPYNFPTYVQYVKQSDGTYKLNAPKTPPAYAWNADNSLPSSVTGSVSGYGAGYGTGYTGSTGRGFTMTSSGN